MSVLATVLIIGGRDNSSTYFTYGTGTEGGILRRIGLWAGPSGFGGVRLWLTSSDTPQTFGATQGTYREFTFENGERITRLSLWGNGTGTRSGAIDFQTTRNRSFRHQMTSWSLRQEFPVNVASGICVGARGWWGPDVIGLHALGLTFVNELSFARMTNVRYPTLDFEAAGINTVSIRDIHDTNESHTTDKEWMNSGSYSATTFSSWSVTTEFQYHVSVSISAGIPFLADVQGEVGWQIGASMTQVNGSEETESWTWERSGVIPPRHWHQFLITTRRGRIAVLYEATMEVSLRNGASFSYPLRGLYEGVSYSRMDIVTRNAELSSADSVTSSTTPATRVSPCKEKEVAQGSITTRVRDVTSSAVPPPDHAQDDQPMPGVGGQVLKGKLGGEDEFIQADTATGDGKPHEPTSEERSK